MQPERYFDSVGTGFRGRSDLRQIQHVRPLQKRDQAWRRGKGRGGDLPGQGAQAEKNQRRQNRCSETPSKKAGHLAGQKSTGRSQQPELGNCAGNHAPGKDAGGINQGQRANGTRPGMGFRGCRGGTGRHGSLVPDSHENILLSPEAQKRTKGYRKKFKPQIVHAPRTSRTRLMRAPTAANFFSMAS